MIYYVMARALYLGGAKCTGGAQPEKIRKMIGSASDFSLKDKILPAELFIKKIVFLNF